MALDVGCGSNKLSGSIGVDISRDSDADIFADAQHLPFQSEVFDLVQCHCVLEHLDNPEEAVVEVRRVLKSEGIFICWLTPKRYANPCYYVLAKLISDYPFCFLDLKWCLNFAWGLQKHDPIYFHKRVITPVVFQRFTVEKKEKVYYDRIWGFLCQGRKRKLFSKFLNFLPKWGGIESVTMKKEDSG